MSVNWKKHFDQIYCLHFLGQTEKFPRLRTELARVGILDSGIFQFRYNSPSPYDALIWKAQSDRENFCPKPSFVNICLEIRRILSEAIAFGYKRILLLENDIAFLNDLDELNRLLELTPEEGVVQYDKFLHTQMLPDYNDRLVNFRINENFIDGRKRGCVYTSAGCIGIFGRGIQEMLRVMSEKIVPTDIAPQLMSCPYAIAIKPLCVQVMYSNSYSIEAEGVDIMHLVYKNQGIDYSDYAVPDGYGYGKVIDKTGRAVAGNNDDSDEFLNHVENDKPLVCKGRKKISVYAIAKNEAKHVARWFDCMKEADEICVLDTGSTDDTVKLLLERGAKVSVKKYDEFLFDRARNDARKLVSKDADILFALDLDETIAPGWRKILEDAWIAAEDEGRRPAYAEYGIKTNLDNGEIAYINKIHSPADGVWEYGIHEALKFDRHDAIQLPPSFCLEHHPDGEKSRAQYMTMLERAVRKTPDSARLRMYYGRELANGGRLDDALKELDKGLQLSTKAGADVDSQWRSVAMFYIAKIYDLKRDGKNAELWGLRSVLEMERRDNCYFLAKIYEALKDPILSNKAYTKTSAITERSKGYPDEPEAWSALFYGRYSKNLWEVGEYEKSRQMAEVAHRMEPDNKDYINLLNEIKSKMPQPAAK